MHLPENALRSLCVTVEKLNPPPAPVQHRVLCRVKLPADLKLFSGERYQPLSSDAAQTAA